MIWLFVTVAVVLAVLVALGVDDTRWRRRALPRVRQRPPRVPYLPETASGPWQPEFHLNRGRRVRAARARYRWPQDPPRIRLPRPTEEDRWTGPTSSPESCAAPRSAADSSDTSCEAA
ncbi:hypothetical protein [Streptomyces sp. NBC_00582]|uniref:hypothetical protein n=1 Tax=Streptomyces sp. NBC_00582 TaxID=2975783 RepID=UPI002E819FE0|nr:hypothetical protein [Streptomyces sp. NBC_00582]WUB61503.1 hypothetical protein OG852_14440 [Streptomyces sp. NBC_00582]